MNIRNKTGFLPAVVALLLTAAPLQAEYRSNQQDQLRFDARSTNANAQRNTPGNRTRMSRDYSQDPQRVLAPGGMYGRDNNLGARDPDRVADIQVNPRDLVPRNHYGSNTPSRSSIRSGDRTSLNRQDTVRDSERFDTQQPNQPGTRRHLGSQPQGISQTPSSAGGTQAQDQAGSRSRLGTTLRAPASDSPALPGPGSTTSTGIAPGLGGQVVPSPGSTTPGTTQPGSEAPGWTVPGTNPPPAAGSSGIDRSGGIGASGNSGTMGGGFSSPGGIGSSGSTSPGATSTPGLAGPGTTGPGATVAPPNASGSPSMGGTGPGTSGAGGGTLGGSTGGMGGSSAGGGGAPGR